MTELFVGFQTGPKLHRKTKNIFHIDILRDNIYKEYLGGFSMTRDERRCGMLTRADAAKYRKELKGCISEEEKKALKIACNYRIRENRQWARKLEGPERAARLRAIGRFAFRICLINLFNR